MLRGCKKANMVKLPVIVYNRKSQADVYGDAIAIRAKLETQAKKEQETSGRYIRPIVLFQAQPRHNADSNTYEKIKKTLVDGGIPEKEIAIKTGDKDELKHVNLLSPDWPHPIHHHCQRAERGLGLPLCLRAGYGGKPHFYRGCGADF